MKQANPSHRQAIGFKLRRLREDKNWSQAGIALQMGVSQRAVSYWEQGERLPHSEEMWGLCQMYGVTFESLVGDVFGQLAPARRSA